MWCGCTSSDIQSLLALVLASFGTCAPDTQKWLKWLSLPKLLVYLQNKLSPKSRVINCMPTERLHLHKYHVSESIQTNAEWHYHTGKIKSQLISSISRIFQARPVLNEKKEVKKRPSLLFGAFQMLDHEDPKQSYVGCRTKSGTLWSSVIKILKKYRFIHLHLNVFINKLCTG